jgi:uncharacterized protein YggE
VKSLWAVKGVVFFTLMTCLLGVGQAAVASDEPVPRILVSGEGSVDIAPDMAVLTLSVMREAPTARAALTANSAAMAKVLDAMSALGIEKRDLQTANFSIQPRYTRPPRQGAGAGEAPKLVGYTVRNALSVRVRDISRVGEVLDTSVTLGVNEGGSIQFTNDDASQAITQARIKAMEDALSKGRTLARAAGVKVGKVLEISEQNHRPRPVAMARMEMVAMDSMANSVPIAAGENTYKVTVNLTLAIAQ